MGQPEGGRMTIPPTLTFWILVVILAIVATLLILRIT
jgi:hypothetical protein